MAFSTPEITIPLVILGPTASGKSGLALALAQRVGAEVLSVDSMQIYRGMNVGTAKPSAADRALVPHHLIDVANPDESFTVARAVEMADAVIASAKHRKVPVVATGGTPLYFKALFAGIFDGPGADDALRLRLQAYDNENLHARLSEVDPNAAARIHLNDTRRLVRALEVYELTGKPISSFQTEWLTEQPRHPAVWIGLSWDRDTLNGRINARTKAMFTEGWVEETRSLLQRYGKFSKTASMATGYAEITRHLAGEISLNDAMELIKIATRQLARRQMKWFRRFPAVHWLAGDAALPVLVDKALALWQSTP